MKHIRLDKSIAAGASLLALAVSLPVSAHRVNVFAWPEGREIVVESGFSGGSKARGAVVTVTSPAGGAALATGKTDAKGIWRFVPPEALVREGRGAMVTVDAGEGHRNTWMIEPEEIASVAGNSVAAAPSVVEPPMTPEEAAGPEPVAAAKPVVDTQAAPVAAAIDEAALRRVVDESVAAALDRRLAPLEKRLAQSLEGGPRLQDIVGGIGWLIGLGGIAAWLTSRRKKDGGSAK